MDAQDLLEKAAAVGAIASRIERLDAITDKLDAMRQRVEENPSGDTWATQFATLLRDGLDLMEGSDFRKFYSHAAAVFSARQTAMETELEALLAP